MSAISRPSSPSAPALLVAGPSNVSVRPPIAKIPFFDISSTDWAGLRGREWVEPLRGVPHSGTLFLEGQVKRDTFFRMNVDGKSVGVNLKAGMYPKDVAQELIKRLPAGYELAVSDPQYALLNFDERAVMNEAYFGGVMIGLKKVSKNRKHDSLQQIRDVFASAAEEKTPGGRKLDVREVRAAFRAALRDKKIDGAERVLLRDGFTNFTSLVTPSHGATREAEKYFAAMSARFVL